MSLALNKVRPVRVVDPELDWDNNNYYAVLKGSQRTSWKPIISTSYSNSSATFSAPPPSPNICVSRNVKLLQPVTIDFIGNAPLGEALLQSQFDAFRAYPLSSNISTIQLDLNNTSFSINMSDTIQALLRYHNPNRLKNSELSTTPSTLDKSQQYSDLANSIHNPLGSVVDTALGGLDGRGAFPITSITNNISTGILNDTTAQIQATFTEDLFLSPLLFGTCEKESGFIGLQTFQLIVNWNSDLTRFWCHDDSGGITLTSITVTLGQPILLFQYKTPNPLMPIPSTRSYPYYEIQRYPTDANAAITAGNSEILSSSNIQLNSIPRMLYIFARKRNSDLTFTDTDTFLSIEKISINWANQSGLLSSATKQDLYEMSQRNGCNLNWRDWSGEGTPYNSGSTVTQIHGVGSVLAIEFGTDIGLDPAEAPGLNGTYQLQMEVTVKNQSAASITPTLYVTVVNEGVFTLENNSAYSQIGVISKEDVMNSAQVDNINYNDLKYMSGAAIFKNFGRKLRHSIAKLIKFGERYGPKAVKTAKQIAPYAKQLYELGKMVGIGKRQVDVLIKERGMKGAGIYLETLKGTKEGAGLMSSRSIYDALY